LDGHPRQAGQHVAQVGARINAPSPTTFDDGIEDRATIPGLDFANKQPVLFA
jgi:hypothetical protein